MKLGRCTSRARTALSNRCSFVKDIMCRDSYDATTFVRAPLGVSQVIPSGESHAPARLQGPRNTCHSFTKVPMVMLKRNRTAVNASRRHLLIGAGVAVASGLPIAAFATETKPGSAPPPRGDNQGKRHMNTI